jgi:hypothetical protein
MRRQDGDDEAGRGVGEHETVAPSVARAPAPREASGAPAFSQAILGWLTPESAPASLVVDFAGNASGPLRARSTVRLDEAAIGRAVATRQAVTLLFEEGDATRPIVIGLVQEPPSPLEDLLRKSSGEAAPPEGAPPEAAPPETARPPSIQADVDGKRVVISAEREITFTCGEASLTLRRDGKILLRGRYVETYSQGVNRIKGAQVKIN